MIVLRKINSRFVKKIIHPGQTEQFFDFDLNKYESFDWKVRIDCNGKRNITKISSLYNENLIESTGYAFLGTRLNADTDVSVINDACRLEITNNESELIECSVKVKTF